MANTRYMNTTTKTEFGPKHVAESGNIVGRRVMKDQSGQPVAPHNRDEELLVTQGFLERPQITSNQELKQLLPEGSYLNQQPITFYTEKVNDGTFYMSKHNNDPNTAFRKNNEFLKTYNHYTHIKN